MDLVSVNHARLVPVPACEWDFHFPSWTFGYLPYACFHDRRSYPSPLLPDFFFPQRLTECLLHARYLVRRTKYNEEHDSHGSCFYKFIMHLRVKISSNHDTLNKLRVTKNKTVFGETHTPCPIFSMGSWMPQCTLIHGTLTTFQRLWEFDHFAS